MTKQWHPSRRLLLAGGASLMASPAIVRAQSPLQGFPPGVFQNRGALDANGVATNTLNPSDISANGVLSLGNLQFKNNNGADARIGVRSVNGHTKAGGGKWYFEWQNNTALNAFSCLGISPTTQAFSTFTFNGAGGSGAATDAGGGMYVNGNIDATVTNNGGSGSGGFNAIAVDLDNLKMWVFIGFASQWNSGAIGVQNPATNTGGMDISALASGTYYATVQLFGDQNQLTTNFGGSAFHFTIPSGYLPY